MRNIFCHATFWSAVALNLIAPFSLSATPREVILYPDAAYITEVTSIRLQPAGHDRKKAVFHLPSNADPQSLTIGFERAVNMQIENIQHRSALPDDDDSLKFLRNRLRKTQDERNDLISHIKALEVQLQFWQAQTKGKAKNAADAVATSSALGKNVRWLYREKISKEAELGKVDQRKTEQAREIEKQENSKRPISEITLFISGAQTGEAVLKYAYFVDGCGWAPRYRIEANSQTGQVIIAEQVDIRQDTAGDWKQVAMRIAIPCPVVPGRPDHGQSPPLTQPNTKNRKHEEWDQSRHRQPFTASGVKTDPASGIEYGNTQSALPVFSADLGILDLPAGSSRIVALKNHHYPAEFSYLLQPSRSPHAVLIATLREPVAVHFSTAPALLSINGTVAGNKTVSFSETPTLLHFGNDPDITVDRRHRKASTGGPAITTEIKNTKSTPVKVEVEELLPPSIDEKTGAPDCFDPAPCLRNGRNVFWRFELPAGDTKTITVFARDH